MKYVYHIGEVQLTLMNMENGEILAVGVSDPRFKKVCELIKAGKYEDAFRMDTKTALVEFSGTSNNKEFKIEISDGEAVAYVKGMKVALHNAIFKRIMKMVEHGFGAQPLVNFLGNLYNNPSKTAIDELFLFMENNDLPITDDGYLIAYKLVRSDYKDIHSGTMDNRIGKVVEVPRFSVDDNRNNTCSTGLHFCSRSYIPNFGSSRRDTDRLLILKINPKDVVSIPSDYNNAKGRACRYEVIGEVENGRDVVANKDYTESPVVSGKTDKTRSNKVKVYNNFKEITKYFQYHLSTKRWHDVDGKMVGRNFVANEFSLTREEVLEVEIAILEGSVILEGLL